MTESITEQSEDTVVLHSAAQQESEIPLGWKPTAQKPVPVTRCVQIKKDGERCKNWSLRGYVRCRKHAGPGALMPDGNVNKYREAVQEAARLRLLDNSDIAVETLEQLMQPGSSEGIRLKAAESVLDRAGIRGGFEIQVEADITVNPADTVKERLAKLAAGAQAVQSMRERSAAANPDTDDIVDAEIVDDEQGTLF